jgi:uncharacterized caspase-like protein
MAKPLLRSGMFGLALLPGLALSPLPAFAQDHPLRGVALVIGESDYATLRKLDNPKRDARAIDDMLDSLGFTVDRVLDGDARKLRAGIADFVDEARDADVALVYYSGHGIEAGGADYLVPTDASLATPQTAGESLVPVNDLLDQLAKTVPVTIVLLDACRTNSFPEGQLVQLPGNTAPVEVAPSGLEAVRGPIPVAKREIPADNLGMVIGFAASPGEPALDGAPDGNSPYAAALLKHFAAGGYSFADLMTMVSEEVYLETKARQLPWVNSSLRRVLSFGKPVEEGDGDERAIKAGRRALLLTIAGQPEATQRYVETVANQEGVPLDALYGMLKVLGVDTSGGEAALQKQLLQGAEQLKTLMADKPGGVKTDVELVRLAGLADKAQEEGAIDLALKFRAQASARADDLSAKVDATEANLRQDRLQIGETYADHARTAVLNFDFTTAAEMWGKAYEQVAKWDDKLALTYKWREADALADLGGYKGDNEALRRSIDTYADALELANEGSDDWANIRNATGNAWSTLGQRQSAADALEQAVAAYEDALTVKTRDHDAHDWAGTTGNLAVALMYIGQRERGTEKLDRAKQAFTEALQAMDREASPLDWGHLQGNLGSVLLMLGDRTGNPALLRQAADANQAALEVLTRDKAPLDWALAETDYAQALADLAQSAQDRNSGRILDQAIDAFRSALEERTQQKVPLDWAMTEDSLGSALATRAQMTGSGEDFDAAITAFEAALMERTKERTPLDWANTKRNLALAQKKRAEGMDGPEAFDGAIANYQDALTVYSKDNSPIDWAQTQAILGIAALARADRSGQKSDLRLAREAYASALQVFGQVDADYASYIKGKLKDIDKRLKR